VKNVPLKSVAVEKGLVGGPFGSSLVSRDYVDDGVPVIRGANMSHGRYVDGDFVRVSEAKFERDLVRNSAEGGDLVYTQRGTLGQVALLRTGTGTHVVSQSQMRLRVNQAKADPTYVYYASTAPHFLRQISNSAISTGVPHINLGILSVLEIPLPPLSEQRAIAATLGALDDKIESNRRAMAKLDELFHTVWRREYKELPRESEINLSEIVTTQYGLTASASSDVVGDRFLRVTDINKRNWIEWSTVPSVPTDDTSRTKYALSKGDLLVARMADPGKSAIYEGGPPAVFASYLVRLKPRSYEEALFVYGFLKSLDYANYAAGAMTGSVQKNMNAKVIVGASIKRPSLSVLSRFAGQAQPLRKKLSQLVDENARLEATRDALLPGLLSDAIRVSDNGAET